MSVLDDGSVGPHHHVSLSMQSHYELICAAEQDGGCPRVMRFRDYWGEEVLCPSGETPDLLNELRRLVSTTSHPELHELVALCGAAVEARMGILAVPD